ncbi:type III pantothenate kinase [Hymenobacter sp. DH14]|uniref:Type III pantothenate kinase n=1 Tax=Hymenobacter cyanobacteriorum TaxID=2926463 RepID=A0A9X1VHC7_9BACT|nr:type III pantothenate kinase [Hymenobacter cyanobacteriorum]MCI1188282.1 type III pantothenate kinase [Hymenobacter cyanobacteriorum]
MHTLALDIGNTAVKAGAFDGPLLREMAAGLTAQQVRELVQRWQPQHVVVASVAEAAVLVVEDLRDLVPGEILAFSPATTLVPLRNAYATPHSLGADRLAAAVGAAKLRPGRDTLVIDAGTALKFDLVTADETYHGGSIAPGLRMRLQALHAFTGRLPLLELPPADATIPLVGDSTTGSLLSGVVNGTVAEIEGLLAQYQQQHPGLGVVLTGGDAAFLAARLPKCIFVVPELVLLGLNRILAYHVDK